MRPGASCAASSATRRRSRHCSGEAVTASVLLAATLKFRGTLTLQLAGRGLVRCWWRSARTTFASGPSRTCRVSGSYRARAGLRELVGDGRLAVTIEAEEREARYQGIVALQGAQPRRLSRELLCQLRAAAHAHHAVGRRSLAQPACCCRRCRPLEPAEARALLAAGPGSAALKARMAALGCAAAAARRTAEQVLQRICGRARLPPVQRQRVRFVCRCSHARVAGLLRSLGARGTAHRAGRAGRGDGDLRILRPTLLASMRSTSSGCLRKARQAPRAQWLD